MSRLRITDNHEPVDITHESDTRYCHDEIDDNTRKDLQRIANAQIKDLKGDERPNLLVFPRDLGYYGDDLGEGQIISFHDDCISTGNIMGFVGVNNTQVDIVSQKRMAKTISCTICYRGYLPSICSTLNTHRADSRYLTSCFTCFPTSSRRHFGKAFIRNIGVSNIMTPIYEGRLI